MKINLFVLYILFLSFPAIRLAGQDVRLEKPDQIWSLPPDLKEISALTFSPDEKYLLCLQDEQGTVYGLDPQTGNLSKEWRVTGKGDYEGIEMVDSTLYLLRSDGIIFRTQWRDGPDTLVERVDPGFPKGTDLEGLGYDPVSGSLLLGIKDFPESVSPTVSMVKGWVHWHPNRPKPDNQLHGITEAALREGILNEVDKDVKGRLIDWLDQEEHAFPLGPSGLAIHPTSREIWMLSARGKLLLVFSPEGEYMHIHPLNPSILPQPEGIAFNRRGDLFIASEGKKSQPGRVVIYRNRK